MKSEVFEKLSRMELEIANFYSKIDKLNLFPSARDIIVFLAQHSFYHSRDINFLSVKYQEPEIDYTKIETIYGQIIQSLKAELNKTTNFIELVEKCSKTEEQVGKLYIVLANYYEDLADYYSGLSKSIKSIADDEFQHSQILKDNITTHKP